MTRAKTSDQSTPGSYSPKPVTAPALDELTPNIVCVDCQGRGFIDVMVDGVGGERDVAQEPCEGCDPTWSMTELRGLAEDFSDRQGNVYRLDLLNLIDEMEEQRGVFGRAARQEMRAALAAASDDQGNVRRGALHSALDRQKQA